MNQQELDRKLFKALNSSEIGKLFVDYLERLKHDMMDLSNLTVENLESHKLAVKIIDKHIIEKIIGVNQPSKNDVSEFE